MNNIPVLDFEICGVSSKHNNDCISMDVDYTSSGSNTIHPLNVSFNIFNIGLGAALDLKYGISIDSQKQDGKFWLNKNRIVKSQSSIFQQITFYIPQKLEFRPTLHVYYQDVLGNKYCKSVELMFRAKSGSQSYYTLIVEQDVGVLLNETENKEVFLLVYNNETTNE